MILLLLLLLLLLLSLLSARLRTCASVDLRICASLDPRIAGPNFCVWYLRVRVSMRTVRIYASADPCAYAPCECKSLHSCLQIYGSFSFCANRMTGRAIDAWKNNTQQNRQSTRLQISRVEPDALRLPVLRILPRLIRRPAPTDRKGGPAAPQPRLATAPSGPLVDVKPWVEAERSKQNDRGAKQKE